MSLWDRGNEPMYYSYPLILDTYIPLKPKDISYFLDYVTEVPQLYSLHNNIN